MENDSREPAAKSNLKVEESDAEGDLDVYEDASSTASLPPSPFSISGWTGKIDGVVYTVHEVASPSPHTDKGEAATAPTPPPFADGSFAAAIASNPRSGQNATAAGGSGGAKAMLGLSVAASAGTDDTDFEEDMAPPNRKYRRWCLSGVALAAVMAVVVFLSTTWRPNEKNAPDETPRGPDALSSSTPPPGPAPILDAPTTSTIFNNAPTMGTPINPTPARTYEPLLEPPTSIPTTPAPVTPSPTTVLQQCIADGCIQDLVQAQEAIDNGETNVELCGEATYMVQDGSLDFSNAAGTSPVELSCCTGLCVFDGRNAGPAIRGSSQNDIAVELTSLIFTNFLGESGVIDLNATHLSLDISGCDFEPRVNAERATMSLAATDRLDFFLFNSFIAKRTSRNDDSITLAPIDIVLPSLDTSYYIDIESTCFRGTTDRTWDKVLNVTQAGEEVPSVLTVQDQGCKEKFVRTNFS